MSCNERFPLELTLMARKSSLPYSRVSTMVAVDDEDAEVSTVAEDDSLPGDMTIFVPTTMSV